MHFLFEELKAEKVNVELNFFQDKHGKNERFNILYFNFPFHSLLSLI